MLQNARRFNLFDAIVLIAATAVALTAYGYSPLFYIRFFIGDFRQTWNARPTFHASLYHTLVLVQMSVWALLLPLLSSWTIALLPLRMMRPRPRWRRLTRQPGFIACCVASLVLVVETSLSVLILGSMHTHYTVKTWGQAWTIAFSGDGFRQMGSRPGFAVAAAWITLAMTGRCRPASDWVDRLGRVIGWIWVLLIPLFTWMIGRG